ncbi:MAG: hypothetical protein HY238_11035 [Acidobacteria bacterium]|nr:hypothetical protein [Acidobacteriota bacterium]
MAFHMQPHKEPNPNTGGTPDPARLEVQPAVELGPLIEGVEFQELVEDIRANGLRAPILLDPAGRVLGSGCGRAARRGSSRASRLGTGAASRSRLWCR